MTILKCRTDRHMVWGSGMFHGRVDYDCEDHLFSQMCHEEYFGPIHYLLKKGDYIFITDRDQKLYEVIVDEIDNENKLVRFSLLREMKKVPVGRAEDRGNAVRWKGPILKWCVLDSDGEVLEKGLASREKAERALEVLLSKAAA